MQFVSVADSTPNTTALAAAAESAQTWVRASGLGSETADRLATIASTSAFFARQGEFNTADRMIGVPQNQPWRKDLREPGDIKSAELLLEHGDFRVGAKYLEVAATRADSETQQKLATRAYLAYVAAGRVDEAEQVKANLPVDLAEACRDCSSLKNISGARVSALI